MSPGFSTLSTSLIGIQRGLYALHREAQSVAHTAGDGAPENVDGAMVRIIEQKQMVEANAAAVRRVSRALGSVVDVLV